jgi:hypothetical protein
MLQTGVAVDPVGDLVDAASGVRTGWPELAFVRPLRLQAEDAVPGRHEGRAPQDSERRELTLIVNPPAGPRVVC